MRFKKRDKQMTFGEMEIIESLSSKNRTLETFKEIKAIIDWDKIEKFGT